MHHTIWVEHDGSWTWSIEEGKAFEDDHKVLARDDSFPTRGHAKEDMLKAWAKLIEQGKTPGRPGQQKTANVKSSASKKTTSTATASAKPAKGDQKASVSPTLPEWAVVVEGSIVALFATKAAAQAYAKAQHDASHTIQKIGFGAVVK